MPKIKTKKSLAKKIKITKTGKIMRSHQMRAGHLHHNRSKSALRRHQQPLRVNKSIEKTIKKMLGRA